MKTLFALATVFAALLHSVGAAAPRPNVILIMGDDMGISDLGCYGSEIDTPVLDKLAADGLRFTQFYNTARCCPTRASLLSGLYPHQAGVGWMMVDRGHDGYKGELNRECLTIAEAMKLGGYGTYMAGKWHVTKHTSPNGPKENWPMQRGFDRFYGTIHGAGSLWDPNTLTRDNTQLSPDNDPEYKPEKPWFYTDAIADQTARYIRDHAKANPEKPFFAYVSFTAAHWPMHAREETIQKYRGKYDGGYKPIREARFEKMKRLGIIKADTELSPQAREWGWEKEEAWEIRCMEVYAAMVDEMDQGIGHIVETVRDIGQLDNTLILFLQDNGGCAEAYGRQPNKTTGPRADKPSLEPMKKGELQPHMQPRQTRDGYPMRTGPGVMPGPADTYIGYGLAWANVSNTPFREYKHWVHEGGISTPLIAHWPAGIKRKGELDRQPGHLIDIMATCVDLAGVKYPQERDGLRIKPLEGLSLDSAFKGDAMKSRALFWEHEGNCAVRLDNWKLVRKEGKEWELYDIAADRPELHNLAREKPKLVEKLASAFEQYAERADVAPVGTWRGQRKKKPETLSSQERFELKAGDDLPKEQAPNIAGRGLLIEGSVKSEDKDGVILAQGGDSQGYAVILNKGKLEFLTCVNGSVQTRGSKRAVPSTGFDFRVIMSPRGQVTLQIGNEQIGGGRVAPLAQMPIDGLQVGRDSGGSVGDYDPEFPLEGEIALKLTLLPDKQQSSKSALAPIEEIPGLPRVLLIGDSISIGYTKGVRELLAGEANVHRPRTNCGPTTRGLAQLDQWLGDGDWDLIHFNWGLHDLKYVGPQDDHLVPIDSPNARQQVPIEDYRKNLNALVARLQETGATLIWRNTTPVPEGAVGRVVGDSAKYNSVAAEIMAAKGIPTHDLFGFAKPRWSEIGRKADVHFTGEGSRRLADEVARVIAEKL